MSWPCPLADHAKADDESGVELLNGLHTAITHIFGGRRHIVEDHH